MKHKISKNILITSLMLISLSGCFGKNHFTDQLDKQFGKGTYTFEKNTAETESYVNESYVVTLNDYPEYPFLVGSATSGLPYEFSEFQYIFKEAILDEYQKETNDNSSFYKLEDTDLYSGNINFVLLKDIDQNEFGTIYDNAEKIISIINNKYPVYNSADYTISVRFVDYSLDTIASCKDGTISFIDKNDFLAYEKLKEENTINTNTEGIEVSSRLDSSITIGVDTLQSIALKGFHIIDLDNYASLFDTKIAPNEKGLSAWSSLDRNIDFENNGIDPYWNQNIISDKNNYVYIETTNLGSEPCALKDTIITKVIYHFYDMSKATTDDAAYLYLDNQRSDLLENKIYYDWDLKEPESEKEKQNGTNYKNLLIKIESGEHLNPNIFTLLIGKPLNIKQIDITLTLNK